MRATSRILKEDHEHIRRALHVIQQMVSRIQNGHTESLQGGDAADVVRFLQTFADRHHQGKEEGVLFPALLSDRSHGNYARLRSLSLDHERGRLLITGLEEAVYSRRERDFVYYASRLIDALDNHLDRDEAILMNIVSSTLTVDEDEKVASAMRNYDKAGHAGLLSLVLYRLREMELKYSRKDHVTVH